MKYTKPMAVSETTRLRVGAFLHGRAVCLESEGSFAKNGPLPPQPDVRLSTLKPTRSVGFGHTYGGDVRYSGNTRPPQTDRSNLGGPLRVNRTTYTRGLGVHAPCAVEYALKPEFRRFVALAGADENLVEVSNGSNLAQFPSVVFKVLIDGKEAAVSPVMRVKTAAWHFDVPIPTGSQRLSLVAMDAGNGSREDFADWAEAGFVVQR
jgi:hypothetical protein